MLSGIHVIQSKIPWTICTWYWIITTCYQVFLVKRVLVNKLSLYPTINLLYKCMDCSLKASHWRHVVVGYTKENLWTISFSLVLCILIQNVQINIFPYSYGPSGVVAPQKQLFTFCYKNIPEIHYSTYILNVWKSFCSMNLNL